MPTSCRTLCTAVWLLAVCASFSVAQEAGAGAAGAQATLQVTEVGAEELVVALEEEIDPKRYTLREIYDVYAASVELDGHPCYLDLVDSVYLARAEKSRLVFHYVWAGEQRNLEEGHYLQATGRQYRSRAETIRTLLPSAAGRGGAGPAPRVAGIVLSGAHFDILNVGAADTQAEGAFQDTGPSFGGDLELLLHLFNQIGLRARIASGPYLQSVNLSVFAKWRHRLENVPISLCVSAGFFPWSTPMTRYTYSGGYVSSFRYMFAAGLGLGLHLDGLTGNPFLKRLILELEYGGKMASSIDTLSFFGPVDLFLALKLGLRLF